MVVGPVRRDEATEIFFDGTNRNELLLRKCNDGHYSEPAAGPCTTCGSTQLEWAAAGGGARVVSWSVVHGRPKGDEPAQQTVLVVAELDEGPWYWSQVVNAEPDAIKEGQRLLLDFDRFSEEHEAVPVFRVA